MLFADIEDFDISYVCGSLPIYQRATYYCTINGCLGYALEEEDCNVNKDALPLFGTLIACCNIKVHNNSSSARY